MRDLTLCREVDVDADVDVDVDVDALIKGRETLFEVMKL